MICQSYPYRHISALWIEDNGQSECLVVVDVLRSPFPKCFPKRDLRKFQLQPSPPLFILTISDADTCTPPSPPSKWPETLKKHRYPLYHALNLTASPCCTVS